MKTVLQVAPFAHHKNSINAVPAPKVSFSSEVNAFQFVQCFITATPLQDCAFRAPIIATSAINQGAEFVNNPSCSTCRLSFASTPVPQIRSTKQFLTPVLIVSLPARLALERKTSNASPVPINITFKMVSAFWSAKKVTTLIIPL